jgi:hypothetical protein
MSQFNRGSGREPLYVSSRNPRSITHDKSAVRTRMLGLRGNRDLQQQLLTQLHDALTHGVQDDLGRAVQIQFIHDAGTMRLDRRRTQK